MRGSPVPPRGTPRISRPLQSPRNAQVATSPLPRSVTIGGEQFIFEIDDKVEYYSPRARKWVPATILNVRENDLFDLVLFNGDEELGVDRNDVRPQSKQRGPDSGSADSMATMNKSIRRDTPYKASRTDEYEDGYNIADEYSSDAGYYGESSSGNNNVNFGNNDGEPIFDIGDNVFCRYLGGDEYLPGIIVNRTKDNSNFHVKYENGEEEFPVPKKHLSFEDLGLQAKISRIEFENQDSQIRDSLTIASVGKLKKDGSPLRTSSPMKSPSSSLARDNISGNNSRDESNNNNNNSRYNNNNNNHNDDDDNDDNNSYNNSGKYGGNSKKNITRKDSVAVTKYRLENDKNRRTRGDHNNTNYSNETNSNYMESNKNRHDDNKNRNNYSGYDRDKFKNLNGQSSINSIPVVGDTVDITVVINDKIEKFPAKIEGVNEDGSYTVRYMNGQLGYNVDANNVKFVNSDGREGAPGESVECVVNVNGNVHRFPATIISINDDGTYEVEYGNGSVGHSMSHSNLSFPERNRDVMSDGRSLREPSFSVSPRKASPREARDAHARNGDDSVNRNYYRPGSEKKSMLGGGGPRKSPKHVQFSNDAQFQEYHNGFDNYGDNRDRNSRGMQQGNSNSSEIRNMVDNLRNININGGDNNAEQLLQALVSSAAVTEAAVKASAEASAATAEAIRASSVVSNAISSLIPQQSGRQREEGNRDNRMNAAVTSSRNLTRPCFQVIDWKRQGQKENRSGLRDVPDRVQNIISGDEVTVEVVYRVQEVNKDGTYELAYGDNEYKISNVRLKLNAAINSNDISRGRNNNKSKSDNTFDIDNADTDATIYNLEVGAEYGVGNLQNGDRVEVEEFMGQDKNKSRSNHAPRYFAGYVIDVTGSTCTVKYEDNGDIEEFIALDRVHVLQIAGGVGVHSYTSAQLDDVPIFVNSNNKKVNDNSIVSSTNDARDKRGNTPYDNDRDSESENYDGNYESKNDGESSSAKKTGGSKTNSRRTSNSHSGDRNYNNAPTPTSRPASRPSSSPRPDSRVLKDEVEGNGSDNSNENMHESDDNRSNNNSIGGGGKSPAAPKYSSGNSGTKSASSANNKESGNRSNNNASYGSSTSMRRSSSASSSARRGSKN